MLHYWIKSRVTQKMLPYFCFICSNKYVVADEFNFALLLSVNHSHPFSFDHFIFLPAPIQCTCLRSSRRSSVYDPAQDASFCWLVVKFSGRYFPGDSSFYLRQTYKSLISEGFPLGKRTTVYWQCSRCLQCWVVCTNFPFQMLFNIGIPLLFHLFRLRWGGCGLWQIS